jgi:hypothetical protein
LGHDARFAGGNCGIEPGGNSAQNHQTMFSAALLRPQPDARSTRSAAPDFSDFSQSVTQQAPSLVFQRAHNERSFISVGIVHVQAAL